MLQAIYFAKAHANHHKSSLLKKDYFAKKVIWFYLIRP